MQSCRPKEETLSSPALERNLPPIELVFTPNLSRTAQLVSWTCRVIILNRGSMFAFQWRKFSPPLSPAHRQKRDMRRCNSRGIPPQPPATRVISQWARSPAWHHAVTLHTAVGKICIIFFLFYCEGMLPLVLLWFMTLCHEVVCPQRVGTCLWCWVPVAGPGLWRGADCSCGGTSKRALLQQV